MRPVVIALLLSICVETGRELWRGALPQSGKATPISYRLASGDQFIAIAVGGGGAWGAGDYVVAFKLRRAGASRLRKASAWLAVAQSAEAAAPAAR